MRFIAGCAIVSLPREVDFGNADTVLCTLLTVLSCGIAGLVVDMRATRYSDAAGIRAVVRAHHRAEDLGCWARVVIPHPGVRKAFAVTDAHSLVRICSSLYSALPRGREDAATPPGAPQPPVARLVPRQPRYPELAAAGWEADQPAARRSSEASRLLAISQAARGKATAYRRLAANAA